MPRKLTIHCECDRCGREWFDEYNSGEPMPQASTFMASFEAANSPPKQVQYDLLCEKCVTALGNYFASIAKLDTKKEGEPSSPSDEIYVEIQPED